MTKGLPWIMLCVLLLSPVAAKAQEPPPCGDCAAKAHSPYRAAHYLEKAQAAESEDERKRWLLIALRFDPQNETAMALLSQSPGQEGERETVTESDP